MPNFPRKHQPRQTSAPSLKSRTDSHRYGHSWRKLREAFLAENPTCHCDRVRYWDGIDEEYGVMACGEPGRIAPAVLVDHVKPLSMGGNHDWENLQQLCSGCHSTKTRRFG